MNRFDKTLRIALALLLGVGFAIAALAIGAILFCLALLLRVARLTFPRQRDRGDVGSRAPGVILPIGSSNPPTIETTYTVVGRS